MLSDWTPLIWKFDLVMPFKILARNSYYYIHWYLKCHRCRILSTYINFSLSSFWKGKGKGIATPSWTKLQHLTAVLSPYEFSSVVWDWKCIAEVCWCWFRFSRFQEAKMWLPRVACESEACASSWIVCQVVVVSGCIESIWLRVKGEYRVYSEGECRVTFSG